MLPVTHKSAPGVCRTGSIWDVAGQGRWSYNGHVSQRVIKCAEAKFQRIGCGYILGQRQRSINHRNAEERDLKTILKRLQEAKTKCKVITTNVITMTKEEY